MSKVSPFRRSIGNLLRWLMEEDKDAATARSIEFWKEAANRAIVTASGTTEMPTVVFGSENLPKVGDVVHLRFNGGGDG